MLTHKLKLSALSLLFLAAVATGGLFQCLRGNPGRASLPASRLRRWLGRSLALPGTPSMRPITRPKAG